MSSKTLKELYFSSSDRSNRSLIKKLRDSGHIKKIGPRLYTSLSDDKIQEYLLKNWSEIISNLYPDSHIGFRSAFEFRPSEQGYIFLVSQSERLIKYPGLSIKFVTGPKTIESDNKFIGNLNVSSLERALLENLSTVSKKWAFRSVKQSEIETKLEEVLKIKGEKGLNLIREKSRVVSEELGFKKAFKKLNSIISALLSTGEVSILESEIAQKRSIGKQFDVNCISKLEVLFGELRTGVFKNNLEKFRSNNHFINKAFFESYFSNYIEGTTFDVEEAEDIVFNKVIPNRRVKDSHDILGVYKIVSDRSELRKTPENYSEFIKILKQRHFTMLSGRPDMSPGSFKEKSNRAGNTIFVHPDYVLGTLEKGFEIYKSLDEPMAKAIFISYLVSEVHPFNDGNGRLCRIMLNSELASAGMSTIIIPNVYREDYMLSLKALSRRERAKPLIRMFQRASDFSNIDFSNYVEVLKTIRDQNWFIDSSDGKIMDDF